MIVRVLCVCDVCLCVCVCVCICVVCVCVCICVCVCVSVCVNAHVLIYNVVIFKSLTYENQIHSILFYYSQQQMVYHQDTSHKQNIENTQGDMYAPLL